MAVSVELGQATASDQVGGVTISNDAPKQFAEGEKVVRWKATDAAGNETTATQTAMVTVIKQNSGGGGLISWAGLVLLFGVLGRRFSNRYGAKVSSTSDP